MINPKKSNGTRKKPPKLIRNLDFELALLWLLE
jgi:hypothetical protein